MTSSRSIGENENAANGGGSVPRGALQRVKSAFGEMTSAIRADHAMLRSTQAKYAGTISSERDLAGDAVTKIGFQMMAAYRVMRFLERAQVPVGPKIASRLIRHLYGSDVHWEADFEPGVMIVHGMGLAVSSEASVGPGVILNQNVTLGMGIDPETRATGAPTIEKNVHIGAGATIIGPITIGAGSKIMPGCVVTRSVPPNSIVEAPVPTVKPRSPRTTRTTDSPHRN